MALITTLRQKMGTALVIVVGLSIVSFVLTDFLSQNNSAGGLFNQPDNSVGVIAGAEVPYDLYNLEVARLTDQYEAQLGQRPVGAQLNSIYEAAWELMFVRYALAKEYAKLGIEVTGSELREMVQGADANVDPSIKQAFTVDGEFRREQLQAYLQSIRNSPADLENWTNYEQTLVESRMRLKYENLMLKSDYVNDLQGKQRFMQEAATADIRYLYVPFYSITDSAVAAPTDAELKAYLKEHEDEYSNEDELRSTVFVQFPVTPSTDDTTYYREDLASIKSMFETAENDSLFAVNNSDAIISAYGRLQPASLPPALIEEPEIYEGLVVGPYVNRNGVISLYKVSSIETDTALSARARHILLKPADLNDEASKAETRAEAQRLIRELRDGADFAEMARQYSTDPGSGSRGGDLGWFSPGRMVAEFNDAVFDRTTPGLITTPVETQFGFHIIEVTEAPTGLAYNIAAIDREMVPRQATANNLYREADNFRSEATDLETFRAKAEEKGLQVLEANDLSPMQSSMGSLPDARDAVQWAFKEAEFDEVSKVFEVSNPNRPNGDFFVVAMLTGVKEAGLQDLEERRAELEQKVKEEKKAEMIKSKLAAMGEKSLDDIAAEMGTGAAVYSNAALKLTENSLAYAGEAPEAIGVAFGLEAGKRSAAIVGKNGVVIVELNSTVPATERGDYTAYKQTLLNEQQGRTASNVSDVIKDKAEIEDKRYKFY